MSYLKAVDFVLRYGFKEFGADCGSGLTWKAWPLHESPSTEPRYAWAVYSKDVCIIDFRELEQAFPGKARVYTSLVDAVTACGQFMEHYFPGIIFFD